jgi:hypothetical protein
MEEVVSRDDDRPRWLVLLQVDHLGSDAAPSDLGRHVVGALQKVVHIHAARDAIMASI